MPLRAPLRLPLAGSVPRWAWAMLLALLLPLAQGAAAAHAITHHGTAQQQRDAAPSALDATCVQCLLAAPVCGGALPSTPAAFATSAAAQPAPQAPAPAEAASALALAYQSRAPPQPLR